MTTSLGMPKRRRPWLGFVMFLTGAIVASSLVVAVAAWAVPVPQGMAGPLRVASVAYAPHPTPGNAFDVTAQVAGPLVGPLTVTLQYATYFATTDSASVRMVSSGDRTYQAQIPSHPDGTEVWFVVSAAGPGESPVISDSFTVDVGTVVRDGPSGLSVDGVSHSPEAPMAFESITIDATVTSRSPIAEVAVAYMAICPERPQVVDPPMMPVGPSHYSFTIDPMYDCARGAGTTLLYRVLAMDASGNTAVSDVAVVPIR